MTVAVVCSSPRLRDTNGVSTITPMRGSSSLIGSRSLSASVLTAVQFRLRRANDEIAAPYSSSSLRIRM